jgi:hypothetical protein
MVDFFLLKPGLIPFAVSENDDPDPRVARSYRMGRAHEHPGMQTILSAPIDNEYNSILHS